MDPFTAIGLAAAIVQFVQFSTGVLTTCKEIHDDVGSATAQNKRLEESVRYLERYRRTLSSTMRSKQTDKRIADIANDCAKISLELLDLLKFVSGGGVTIGTARAALRTIRNRKRVEGLQKQLTSREELLNKVLVQTTDTNVREILDRLNAQHVAQQASVEDLGQRMASLLGADSKKREQRHQRIHTRFDRLDQRVDATHATVQAWRDSSEQAKARKAFLDSLFFPEMFLRQSEIKPAHVGTLEWLFEPEGDKKKSWANLVSWLEGDSSVYWLSGKAGSGKSTLMAHISDDARTREKLNSWSGSQKLLIITFFFWRAGTELQKSTRGFLRSVLYQICDQTPRCIDCIIQELRLFYSSMPTWSEKALMEAIGVAVKCADKTRFCLFLDGLDELEGDYDALIDLIFDLQASQQIKCCVSSRPEIELWHRLANCQTLRLQDLNEADIRKFVDNNLQSLDLVDDEKDYLSEKVVLGAEGVFLWASLVVGSLVKGGRAGDDFDVLKVRLQQTPKELTDLIASLIGRIEPMYRETLAFYFLAAKLVQTSNGNFPVNIVSLTAARTAIDAVTCIEFARRCRQTEMQIHAQSAGLLTLKTFKLSLPYEKLEHGDPQKLLAITNHEGSAVFSELVRHEHTALGWIHRSAYEYVFSSADSLGALQLSEDDETRCFTKLAEGFMGFIRLAPFTTARREIMTRKRILDAMRGFNHFLSTNPVHIRELMSKLYDVLMAMPYDEVEGHGSFHPSSNQHRARRCYDFWAACIQASPEYASSHSTELLRDVTPWKLRLQLLCHRGSWPIHTELWQTLYMNVAEASKLPTPAPSCVNENMPGSILCLSEQYPLNLVCSRRQGFQGQGHEDLNRDLLRVLVRWGLGLVWDLLGDDKIRDTFLKHSTLRYFEIPRETSPKLDDHRPELIKIYDLVSQLATKLCITFHFCAFRNFDKYLKRRMRLLVRFSWDQWLEFGMHLARRKARRDRSTALDDFRGSLELMCVPHGVRKWPINEKEAQAAIKNAFVIQLRNVACGKIFERLTFFALGFDLAKGLVLSNLADEEPVLLDMMIQDIWQNRSLTATQQLFAVACVRLAISRMDKYYHANIS